MLVLQIETFYETSHVRMHNFMVSENNNDPLESILTHFSAHKLKSASHDIYQILQWAVLSKKGIVYVKLLKLWPPSMLFQPVIKI